MQHIFNTFIATLAAYDFLPEEEGTFTPTMHSSRYLISVVQIALSLETFACKIARQKQICKQMYFFNDQVRHHGNHCIYWCMCSCWRNIYIYQLCQYVRSLHALLC